MDAITIEHLIALAKALVLLAAGTGLVLFLVRRDDKHENYDSSKNIHRSFK